MTKISDQEKAAILAELKTTDLTRADFAKKYDVPVSALCRWMRESQASSKPLTDAQRRDLETVEALEQSGLSVVDFAKKLKVPAQKIYLMRSYVRRLQKRGRINSIPAVATERNTFNPAVDHESANELVDASATNGTTTELASIRCPCCGCDVAGELEAQARLLRSIITNRP